MVSNEKIIRLSQPVLECDWNLTLPVYNSNAERYRVKQINSNLSLAKYPLTREYLNRYYLTTDFPSLKKTITQYDCAGAMYSYFIMSFGTATGNGGNGSKPGATGANPYSTGFNPYGLIDWDLLPSWLWLLLLAAGALLVKKVLD